MRLCRRTHHSFLQPWPCWPSSDRISLHVRLERRTRCIPSNPANRAWMRWASPLSSVRLAMWYRSPVPLAFSRRRMEI